MKDLSFITPIVDARWLGLTEARPSHFGPPTLVVKNENSISGPWWSVYFGPNISWGVRTDHPADLALLEFAARHS